MADRSMWVHFSCWNELACKEVIIINFYFEMSIKLVSLERVSVEHFKYKIATCQIVIQGMAFKFLWYRIYINLVLYFTEQSSKSSRETVPQVEQMDTCGLSEGKVCCPLQFLSVSVYFCIKRESHDILWCVFPASLSCR